MMSLLYKGRGQSSQLFRGCLNGGCPTDSRTVRGLAWLANSRDRPYDARDAFDRWIIVVSEGYTQYMECVTCIINFGAYIRTMFGTFEGGTRGVYDLDRL
jgi:hypothetical protein